MENDYQEENKIINPTTSGYNDRIMAKWQGMLLSEHSDEINKSKIKSEQHNKKKEKQAPETISHLVESSYRQKKPIAVQMVLLFNGLYEEDIIGIVYGYYERNVYIQTKEEIESVANISAEESVE